MKVMIRLFSFLLVAASIAVASGSYVRRAQDPHSDTSESKPARRSLSGGVNDAAGARGLNGGRNNGGRNNGGRIKGGRNNGGRNMGGRNNGGRNGGRNNGGRNNGGRNAPQPNDFTCEVCLGSYSVMKATGSVLACVPVCVVTMPDPIITAGICSALCDAIFDEATPTPEAACRAVELCD